MRLLFVHDHVFQRAPDGRMYTPGRFPYAVWRRYLQVFDEVEVFARVRDVPDVTSLNLSSGDGVEFNVGHGYSRALSLLAGGGSSVRAALADAMQRSDAVAARLPSELGQLAARVAHQQGRTLAVEAVGCAWDAYWNYGSPAARLYAPVMYLRMRGAVGAAPFVLYVTRKFLQRRYPTRGVTACVSNVELRDVSPEVLQRRLDRIGLSGTKARLGFVGSLQSAYKGLETALRALRLLRAEGRDAVLSVLGDGDPRPWAAMAGRLGVADAVTFCGVLPGGEPVLRWMDDVDVLLHPSRQEGLPRAVIEAMSRGCPVVGSTTGGIPELLSEECLHAPGDWRTLAARVAAVAWDPELQRQLARRNWEESRTYQADLLDATRTGFWGAVAQASRRSKCSE